MQHTHTHSTLLYYVYISYITRVSQIYRALSLGRHFFKTQTLFFSSPTARPEQTYVCISHNVHNNNNMYIYVYSIICASNGVKKTTPRERGTRAFPIGNRSVGRSSDIIIIIMNYDITNLENGLGCRASR